MRWTYLILSLLCHTAVAQHYSDLGRFSVQYPKACAPVTVSVSRHDSFGNISRQYFFEEGLIETPDTFHTYSTPGLYQIIQFIGEDIQPKTDTLLFEVLESPTPAFTIFQCSNTEIAVGIEPMGYDYFIVKFSETDSVVYTPGSPFPTFDYQQNSGQLQVFGFYNDAYVTCPDASASFNLNSPQDIAIISMEVTEECIGDFFLNLQLSTPDPMTLYAIQVQEMDGGFFTIYEGGLTEPNFQYRLDTPLGEDVCIQVNVLNPCSGSTLFSHNECSTTNQDFDLSGAYADYLGNLVRISISPLPSKQVELRRKTNITDYATIATITESYLDEVPSSFRAFQYQLIQQDTCGHKLDSAFIAPPFIQILSRSNSENRIEIEATPPQNALGSFSSSLLFYSEDSTQVAEAPLEASLELPGGLGTTIRMRARYTYPSGVELFSNELSTPYDVVIFIPQAFTPNRDGLNDDLELFGLPTADFEMVIFDRWGAVIHTSTENPVWDGKLGKEKAKEGTYLYRLSFRLESGELKTQVGTFTVLRN